jgi:four helix bundle protein
MKIEKFEDLRIWRFSIEITKEINKFTEYRSFSRNWALKDQIIRALISISSNIVEGFERNNNTEFRRFLLYSKGSAGEARSQLYIARELEYISKEEFEYTYERLFSLSQQIGSMINYLSKINKQKPTKENNQDKTPD